MKTSSAILLCILLLTLLSACAPTSPLPPSPTRRGDGGEVTATPPPTATITLTPTPTPFLGVVNIDGQPIDLDKALADMQDISKSPPFREGMVNLPNRGGYPWVYVILGEPSAYDQSRGQTLRRYGMRSIEGDPVLAGLAVGTDNPNIEIFLTRPISQFGELVAISIGKTIPFSELKPFVGKKIIVMGPNRSALTFSAAGYKLEGIGIWIKQ